MSLDRVHLSMRGVSDHFSIEFIFADWYFLQKNVAFVV